MIWIKIARFLIWYGGLTFSALLLLMIGVYIKDKLEKHKLANLLLSQFGY